MTTPLVTTRHATTDDVDALAAMHRRCSPGTLRSRFHVPVTSVPTARVRQLVSPDAGWSRVAERGGEVVGLACAGALSAAEVEIGILVEDAHQSHGIGSRLLRDLADDAVGRGYSHLLCVAEPDSAALLPTVRRAGLTGVPTRVDGVVEVWAALGLGDSGLPRPA
jgi:GNAT superfamily N-acetyltransferase